MSLSHNPDTILLETNAQLLKNALDSLLLLRNMAAPYDEQTGEVFDKAVEAAQNLQKHLETMQGYPRWVDTWGAKRRWEHPGK